MNNNFIDKAAILEQLDWRYAVKQFDVSRKVSEEDWNALERSLLLAPTSFGLQPFKFLVITDSVVKEKLRPAAWGQPQIADCSHLVVIAARKTIEQKDIDKFFDRLMDVRGTASEKLAGYKNQIEGFGAKAVADGWAATWCQRQAYIALGFLLETAALIGVDACPMEGFDPIQFDEILGLEEYSSAVLCAVGFRSEDDKMASLAKVRFDASEMIERI